MDNITEIFAAIEFATAAHGQQVRKGTKTPYVTHPIGVGRILHENKCPKECIIAGILHDTIEDTDINYDFLKTGFGEEVADIVKGVSEPDKSDTWKNRKEHSIEYLKTAPDKIRMVACADKLHNLRSILNDYNKEGEKLWDRFNMGKEDQIWYYFSMVEAFKSKRYEYPMFRDLEVGVNLLKVMVDLIGTEETENNFSKLNLDEEIEKYFDATSICVEDKPKLVILIGGAGSGKTTIRKEKYSKGYVLIDAAVIFKNIGGKFYNEFGVELAEPMEIIGGFVASKAIKEKRNIVMEMIGDSEEEMKMVIDSLHSCEYKVALECIQCEPGEAYKRSLNKDIDDISAFYTQKYHQKWIIEACEVMVKKEK